MLVHSRLYVTIQQKQIIMTYTVKNRLGYDKIGLLYDSRSRLLDPYSDRMGDVQLVTVNCGADQPSSCARTAQRRYPDMCG